jgi:hypothetical protein
MRFSVMQVVSVVAVALAVAPAVRSVPQEKKPGITVLGKLPDNFVLHAVGTYSGPADVKGVELDRSGHRVGRAEVVVNVPDKPVVLVLTAYDPTVWRVGRTKETTIAGVIVSGYHGQALIGVTKDTPRALSTYTNKGNFPYFFASDASPRLLEMNDAVKALVGREMDRFENRADDQGVFHVGAAPKDAGGVIYSDDLKVEDYARPAAVVAAAPSGEEGLQKLVKDGKLRLATQADIDAWVDKASEKYKRFNPELRIETHMRPGRVYVVVDRCTLPDGLYGAHSRSFIVPDKVPIPDGPMGHNNFYLMDGTERNVRTEVERRMKEQRPQVEGQRAPGVF